MSQSNSESKNWNADFDNYKYFSSIRKSLAVDRNAAYKLKSKSFILALFLIALLVPIQVNSFTTNSSKIFDFAITSGKNADISSSSFRVYSVIGAITGIINSSSFITELGFLSTLPYLDGESCKVNLECAGGFCCSNSCQSSSCPVTAPEPSAAVAAPSGGEGLLIEDFAIDKDLIKALIKQGGTYKTNLSIKNTGAYKLLFDIDYSALREFMLFSDINFALAPNETKDIDVTIFASEEEKPDVYSGNVIIKGGSITKSLPVIIEVRAKKALFDIIVKVLPEYKNVLKTENIKANITLINLGDLKPVDAQLYYAIRDLEGNNLTFGFETLAVYTKISTVKELELPRDMQLGTYILYAKISYGIETAAAADTFNVVSEKPPTCFDGIKNQNEERIDCGGVCEPCKMGLADFFNAILLFAAKRSLSIVIVILLIIIIILLYLLLKRKEEKKEKIEEIEKPKELEKITVLSKSLEKCRNFISEIKDSIETNDVSKAAELYIEARDIYMELPSKEKQEVYNGLAALYSQISELGKVRKRKEELISQKAEIEKKEGLLSKQIELEERRIEETEKRIKQLEEEIQRQKELRRAEELKRQEELAKQRAEEENKKKKEGLLSKQIELEERIVEEKERRIKQLELEERKKEELLSKQIELEERIAEGKERRIKQLEEEIQRQREFEKQRQEQIKAQRIEAIKQIEEKLSKNKEVVEQLSLELRKVGADKRALSSSINEIDARAKNFDNYILNELEQNEGLISKKNSLFEKYKNSIEELNKKQETEKSARKIKAGELRAKLEFEERNLKEEIKRLEINVIEEKKETEDKYKKYLQEISKKERELKQTIIDLEDQKQQALLERKNNAIALQNKENEMQEIRLKFGELAKERELLTAELLKLKSESSRYLMLSNTLMPIYKEK